MIVCVLLLLVLFVSATTPLPLATTQPPLSAGLLCVFGISNQAGYQDVLVTSCAGQCGIFINTIEGVYWTVHGCFPNQLVNDFGINNTCGYLPGSSGNDSIVACACDSYDNCNQESTIPGEPVFDDNEITCYNGFWIDDQPFSDDGYLPCFGFCMSIDMKVTLDGQAATGTYFACMPRALEAGLGIFERCGPIEAGRFTACGCNEANCIDPITGKYPPSQAPTTPLNTFSTTTRTTGKPSKCPNDWIVSASTPNKCYRICNGTASFFDATRTCRSQFPQATLTSIQNGFENSEIRDLEQLFDGVWIGLLQENGNWTWTDGSTSSYRNWDKGEPDGFGDCASLLISSGKWWSSNCDSTMQFVCELILGF